MWRAGSTHSLIRACTNAPLQLPRRSLHVLQARSRVAAGRRPAAAAAAAASVPACSCGAALCPPPSASLFRRPFSTDAATPSSAPVSSGSPARAGGWLCSDTEESVLRLSAPLTASSPAELLKYLHNLATVDVYSLVGLDGSEGFSLFLNSRGRVLFEAMLAPIDEASAHWLSLGATHGTQNMRGPAGIVRAGMVAAPPLSKEAASKSATPRGFYLTVPTAVAPLALAHLRHFNLRRKVVVEDVTDSVQVHQVIPFRLLEERGQAPTVGHEPVSAEERRAEVAQLLGLSNAEEVQRLGLHAAVDPRTRSMGVRILTRRGETPSLPSSFTPVPSPSFFHTFRLLQGIPASPLDIHADKSLPLEIGGHWVRQGGISFDKGCYLGQELTARTHFQGVVRKGVWPAFLTRDREKAQQARGRTLGQLQSPSSATAASAPSSDADPWQQLQHYFPFFDSSMASVPTDSPIVRAPAPTPAASDAADTATSTAPPPKEVARVFSSQHNVLLSLLRTDHVTDHSHTLQLLPAPAAAAPTTEDAATAAAPTPAAQASADLIVVPYRPNWWPAPTEKEGAESSGTT